MLRIRKLVNLKKIQLNSLSTPSSSTSSTSASNSSKSGGFFRFVVNTSILSITTIGGLAYLREHDKLDNKLSDQLADLEKIQFILRSLGLGNPNKINDSKVSTTDSSIDINEHLNESIDHEYNNHDQISSEDENHSNSDLASLQELLDKSFTESEQEHQEQQNDNSSIEQGVSEEFTQSNDIHDYIVNHDTNVSEVESHQGLNTSSTTNSSTSDVLIDSSTQTQVELKSKIEESTPSSSTSTTSTSSDPFLNLRVSTLDNILTGISKQVEEFKNEADNKLVHDLEGLSTEALRYRIFQMSAERYDHLKSDVLILQQKIIEVESKIAQVYGQFLNEQKLELSSELERKHFEKEKQLILEHQKKIDELFTNFEDRLAGALSNQAIKLTSATKDEVEKNEKLIRTQLTDEFTHQLALLKQEQTQTLMQAQEAIISQSEQIKGLNNLVSNEFGKTTVSANSHALSAAVLLIESALLSGVPVDKEIKILKKYSQDDELISKVISTLPDCASTTGIPTLSLIRSRFHVVKDEVRKAGLAPENVSPLLGQIIGNVLATISIVPSKPVDGDGIEAILSRASGYIDDGQLDLALKEVQNIKGYPRTLMADWEEMLTNRLIAEQAAEILRASSALKHVQFL